MYLLCTLFEPSRLIYLRASLYNLLELECVEDYWIEDCGVKNSHIYDPELMRIL